MTHQPISKRTNWDDRFQRAKAPFAVCREDGFILSRWGSRFAAESELGKLSGNGLFVADLSGPMAKIAPDQMAALAALRNAAPALRQRADEAIRQEQLLADMAESGEITYERADSLRFDIWERESESFHTLLALVESALKVAGS